MATYDITMLVLVIFIHSKSGFDCVKSKGGLLNLYNQRSYLASHQLVSQNAVASFDILQILGN